MAQQHIKKPHKQEQASGPVPAANQKVIEKGKEAAKEAAELMDKIDGILEKNAEEFVKNYVQKGGE